MTWAKRAVFGGAIILSGAFAMSANAQTNDNALAANTPKIENTNDPVNTPKYSVGVKDLSDKDNRVAQTMTARVSSNAIVVMYRGSDKELQEKVLAGASAAKDQGIYVRGMVIAKADPNILDGKDNFTIYVDGFPVVDPEDAAAADQEFKAQNDPNVTLEKWVTRAIQWSDKNFLKPAQTKSQASLTNE